VSKVSERADAYAAKTFKLAPPASSQPEQNKLKESLQAVVNARARVLQMFGKR
jgi:phage gp29-like protein